MERMKKPKFIKEIEKLEGKERAECGRWYIRVYGELDHKPMVELESLEMVVKELHKLEEENKKLKEENEILKSENEYRASIVDIVPEGEGKVAEETIQDLQEQIKELKDDLLHYIRREEEYREELTKREKGEYKYLGD